MFTYSQGGNLDYRQMTPCKKSEAVTKHLVVMWIDLTLYGTATRLDNFSRCRLYGQVAAENRFRVDERSGVDRFGQHYAVTQGLY